MGGVKGCCGTPDCGGCRLWCPGGDGDDWRLCDFLDDFGDFLLLVLLLLLPSEPARLSRSAMRSFIFLPVVQVSHPPNKSCCDGAGRPPTVVALGNPVLYPPAFSQIRNLGPVLVGVRRAAEGAASAWVLAHRDVLWVLCWPARVLVDGQVMVGRHHWKHVVSFCRHCREKPRGRGWRRQG